MNKQIPPDLVESIITTLYIAAGYALRWFQNLISKKSKSNESNSISKRD